MPGCCNAAALALPASGVESETGAPAGSGRRKQCNRAPNGTGGPPDCARPTALASGAGPRRLAALARWPCPRKTRKRAPRSQLPAQSGLPPIGRAPAPATKPRVRIGPTRAQGRLRRATAAARPAVPRHAPRTPANAEARSRRRQGSRTGCLAAVEMAAMLMRGRVPRPTFVPCLARPTTAQPLQRLRRLRSRSSWPSGRQLRPLTLTTLAACRVRRRCRSCSAAKLLPARPPPPRHQATARKRMPRKRWRRAHLASSVPRGTKRAASAVWATQQRRLEGPHSQRLLCSPLWQSRRLSRRLAHCRAHRPGLARPEPLLRLPRRFLRCPLLLRRRSGPPRRRRLSSPWRAPPNPRRALCLRRRASTALPRADLLGAPAPSSTKRWRRHLGRGAAWGARPSRCWLAQLRGGRPPATLRT